MTPAPEQRNIEELITLYRYEPALRDVYVEGDSDRGFIEWYLHTKGALLATASEIALVQVPASMTQAVGLPDNNKGRLIALANELERRLGADNPCVTCVVDRDFDGLLGQGHACNLILATDHTCLEMYFFDIRCVSKLLKVVVRGFPKPAAVVLEELRLPLEELFLIRMANHTLGWRLNLIRYEKLCRVTRHGVFFDHAKYILRLLVNNGRAAERGRFLEEVQAHRARLTGDPRDQIHGHDFIDLLSWYMRAYGKREANSAFIERSLPACIELPWLDGEPMLSALLRRAST